MENGFLTLASDRYSCRSYKSESVPATALEVILEAARMAPSACNRQPWRIRIIDESDKAAREAVSSAYNREWVRSAPEYLIVCKVPSEAWVRQSDNHNHADIDVAIITEHICLAATSLGLGTCWICNFDVDKLHEALGLPEEVIPAVVIPLGYPADVEPLKKRKSLGEILI